jgi:uncharacterized membrane protein (UPF0127 family)
MALLAACEHHEPGTSVATAAAPPSLKAAASAAELAQPSCQVPLAEAPPAKVGPASVCPPDPTGPMPLPRGWVSFIGAPGAPRVAVEIAANDTARERGLMYRVKMPEDQGMIFDWTDPAQHSFWMRNTCIPLDMLFIEADGTIAGILEQVPPMDESPRGVPCPVTHVLELNAGWSRAHGVSPGQQVRIES